MARKWGKGLPQPLSCLSSYQHRKPASPHRPTLLYFNKDFQINQASLQSFCCQKPFRFCRLGRVTFFFLFPQKG